MEAIPRHALIQCMYNVISKLFIVIQHICCNVSMHVNIIISLILHHINIQGGAPYPLEQNCEAIEQFLYDFRIPRKILDQKMCFQKII